MARSTKSGVSLKKRDQINAELLDSTKERNIDFHVVRKPDGAFDKSELVRLEKIVAFSHQEDFAVARADRCLGIPEALGHFKLMLQAEIDPLFDSLVKINTPLISAGFPGDQPGDYLRASSSTDYSRAGDDTFVHKISNSAGSSGSPIFVLFSTGADGKRRPLTHNSFNESAMRDQLVNVQELVVVGMNSSENDSMGQNSAILLHHDWIMAKLRKDEDENSALIQSRIRQVLEGLRIGKYSH